MARTIEEALNQFPNARYDKGTYHVLRQNVRALCERWERDADPTDLIVFRPHED